MHVGVRTFGHAVAAVQNRLVAARFLRPLGVDDGGQQVDRLDVAMEIARILHRDGLVASVHRIEHIRLDPDPQARCAAREAIRMAAHAHAARRLHIGHRVRAVDPAAEIEHHRPKLLKRHGNVDVDLLRAAVEAAQMVVQLERHMIDGKHRVIHAVAEEVYPVIERDHQFFRRADFTVIVCKCFHRSFLPDFVVYRGHFTPNFNSMTLLMTSTQLSRPMAALSRQRS